MIYATYDDKHVFINGEDGGLRTVQGDKLLFGDNDGNLGAQSSILGGAQNTASSACSTIAGGYKNQIVGSGARSFIGGGCSNNIVASTQQGNFIGAGISNTSGNGGTSVGCNAVVAGGSNLAVNGGSFVGAGYGNKACSTNSAVVGGSSNCARGACSFVGGGYSNDVTSTYSAIVAGYNNCVTSLCSFVGSGKNNCVAAQNASVLGGYCNRIWLAGSCGVILGGNYNNLCHNNSSILGGNGITTTATNTAYAANATVKFHLQVGGTTTLSTTTGRIDATNDVVSYSTSDKRLKCNIQPIDNALCKLIGVTGNTFDWKELSEEEIQDIHGNKGHDVGVIAQEIESILPEAVTTRDSGYKAVNYEKLVPLLIEAVKALTIKVEKLESK